LGGAQEIQSTLTIIKNFEKRLEIQPLLCYNHDMKHLIDCAAKRENCDLVITDATIFNVFTGLYEHGDIAVKDGKIVGIGTGYRAERCYCAKGLVALPGFLDAHVHVESSMLSPEEFASLACAHGTTGIVADPHEIVNVCGIVGAEYMAEAFARLQIGGVEPLDVYMQLPSCVPATPFETSGAIINAAETEREIARPLFHGLGEMMNYPGVVSGEEETLRKLQATHAVGKVIDGHAPCVTGDLLNAYLAGGIKTDHECASAEECSEKVARGMYVQLRNGSSTRNLLVNYQAVTPFNFRRFILCSDDKNAQDLQTNGHMDDALRRLVGKGVPAEQAICMATVNTAECYRLWNKGALAPSYDADIVLVEDVSQFAVRAVFKRGVLTAENRKALFPTENRYLLPEIRGTVRVKKPSAQDFAINVPSGKVRAMRVVEHTLVTECVETPVVCKDGDLDVKGTNLLKLAVVERHFASGNIGLGILKDYGFKGGAMGISVAHDSHNLVVLGDDNEAMVRVVELLNRAGGGMALVGRDGEDCFPLDIAGLMSSASCDEVVARTSKIAQRAREMGVREEYEPFMTLVFLSLAVIPKLKLTDRGLFDVEKFAFTELEIK